MWTIPIVVLISFFIFKTFLPVKNPPDMDYTEQNQNKRKYGILSMLSVVVMFIILGVLMYLLYIAFNQIMSVIHPKIGAFELYIDEESWLLPSLILAFGLVSYTMDLFYKWILKDDYPNYLAWGNKLYGFDGRRVTVILSKILVLIGVSATFLCFQWSFKINDNQIEINDFLSIRPTTYEFTEVQAVVHFEKLVAPNGDVKNKDHYKIYFNDGNDYSTGHMAISSYRFEPVIDFILDHTDVQLSYQEIDH